MLAKRISALNRSNLYTGASVASAIMIVSMLVAQLYGYESFASTLLVVLPPTSVANMTLIAALIVLVELLALPYLLNMRLSYLMRILSAGCSISIALFWLMVALTNTHASNVAFFSDTVHFHGGVLAFVWSVFLIIAVGVTMQSDIRVHSTDLRKTSD